MAPGSNVREESMQESVVLGWLLRRALGTRDERVPDVAEWDVSLPDLGLSRCLSLAAHFVRVDRIPVSRSARLALVASQSQAEAAVARNRQQLLELAPRLEAGGRPWLVLKGFPLASRLYPSPACRPSGDVDLLIDRSDIRVGDSVLIEAGYVASEPLDVSFHHRRYDRSGTVGRETVELHWASDPPSFAAPPTSLILQGRRRFDSDGVQVWIPGEGMEIDLLIRHFARHAGLQAILHLDLLLMAGEETHTHPLGALVRDDLARLGLPLRIDGPDRWRLGPLRSWMAVRNFAQRREIGAPAVYQAVTALALSRSPMGASREILRYLWPRTPSSQWRAEAATRWGGLTWRLRRLRRLTVSSHDPVS